MLDETSQEMKTSSRTEGCGSPAVGTAQADRPPARQSLAWPNPAASRSAAGHQAGGSCAVLIVGLLLMGFGGAEHGKSPRSPSATATWLLTPHCRADRLVQPKWSNHSGWTNVVGDARQVLSGSGLGLAAVASPSTRELRR